MCSTYFCIFILLLAYCLISVTYRDTEKDYVVAMISQCNYPVEIHKNIKTEDDYLLTMQRIPVRHKENETNRTKTPVLLMHGLSGSAEHFLLLDCANSLAYMLAEQGYDVWLGNVRSVSYSRHHVTLDPDSPEYWQITLDELGTYDLTRLIDYMLETTHQKQIMYIGHSQGNTIYYIMCSNRPEYANKVQLFVNLSPVASMNNFPHPWLTTVCKHSTEIERFLQIFRIYELAFARDFVRNYGLSICSGIFKRICKYVIYLFSGLQISKLSDADMYRLLTNCPEGIAAKQFIHGAQMCHKGDFGKFDYGSPELNLEHYGIIEPPKYNLSYTTTPTAIYYGQNDWFLAVDEVQRIAKQLSKVVDFYELPITDFSHLNFIIGQEASEFLYPRIISLMNKYRSSHLHYVKSKPDSC